MKRQKVKAAIVLAALCIVFTAGLCGCTKEERVSEDKDAEKSKTEKNIGKLTDSEYLLTIDGYGVTEEEFLMFLRDQKAVTANYYWTNYEMQPDKEFWRTEIDGQTPLEYAKERALAAVTEAKVEFALAAEKDILEYKDYDELLADMEEENSVRAEKQEKGEAVYGITEYTPFTYYQYLNGNARAEVEKKMIDEVDPTEEELKKVYEDNKETFSLGQVYDYTVKYADGTEEKVSQNTREIGKEESTKEDLIYNYFSEMKPGQVVENYYYQGKEADVVFESVKNLGYATFEESKESLKAFYARAKLNELIAEKTENAEISMNQERYDALEMP